MSMYTYLYAYVTCHLFKLMCSSIHYYDYYYYYYYYDYSYYYDYYDYCHYYYYLLSLEQAESRNDRRPGRAGLERLAVASARRGTNGVGPHGVTANFMFFDRWTFWVLPLTYFYLPKSARAYLLPQPVKKHYFCRGPISVDPICPQPRSWPGRDARGPRAGRAHAARARHCLGGPLSRGN